MISIHIEKVKALQRDLFDEIELQRKTALEKLRGINLAFFSLQERLYLTSVINLFDKVGYLESDPTELDDQIIQIGDLPANSRFKADGTPENKQLKDFIIVALGYQKLRQNFYPKYFEKLSLKACVYCNSQLTIVLQKSKNDYSARLEVDHHYSKDHFPFLSISLFNLYPCCASCNKRKSTSKIDFKLYSNDVDKLKKSQYSFKLQPKSKAAYLLKRDFNEINVEFKQPDETDGIDSLQSRFYIKEIHDTQKDIVAELIIKSQIYNEEYKKILRNNFSKLALNEKDFERVIVGNYTKDIDIHRRPFSKIMMDIAKQLDLIK